MSRFILVFLLFLSFNASFAEVSTPEDLAKGIPEEDIAKVQNIFRKFTQSLGKDFEDYTVEVHKNDEVNAYATLGKKIVINSGLMDAVDSEAGLAFVIGHELGHVERRHVIKGIMRSSFSGLMRYFVFKQNRLLNGIDYMHTLHYSRGKETEADFFAVDLISELYCSEPGKLEFFEKSVAKQQSSKLQEYFSTHPLPASRLEYLRAEFKKHNCTAQSI